jgi:hypothetical protein
MPTKTASSSRLPPCSGAARLSRRAWLAGVAQATLVSCGGGGGTPPPPAPPPPPATTRSWRLGFSFLPPRPTVQDVLRGIDLWSPRAELAVIHEELPWRDLLAGQSPEAILQRDKVQLVAYMKGKGLQLVVMGELNDGLARESEAPQLRAAGRSLTEPAVQRLYRDYMLAVDRLLQPVLLGLAAETNLVRAAAPVPLYDAVRRTANDTAAALRAAGRSVPLMASVQVETAWGRLDGSGRYVGIDADLADFPFVQTLGLSSYPYFGWSLPEDIPPDCFSRLVAGRSLPVMMVEGGWPSAGAGTVASTPALQARWIERNAALLDAVRAQGWLHLMFADIDLASVPPPVPPNLPLFATIGLADSQFNPKPALAAWDALHARRLA